MGDRLWRIGPKVAQVSFRLVPGGEIHPRLNAVTFTEPGAKEMRALLDLAVRSQRCLLWCWGEKPKSAAETEAADFVVKLNRYHGEVRVVEGQGYYPLPIVTAGDVKTVQRWIDENSDGPSYDVDEANDALEAWNETHHVYTPPLLNCFIEDETTLACFSNF